MHAVFSVYIHYPGKDLQLPSHLSHIPMINTTNHGLTPDWGDPELMEALQQYLFALASRYDGDDRIGFLNTGLLGFYGEFW